MIYRIHYYYQPLVLTVGRYRILLQMMLTYLQPDQWSNYTSYFTALLHLRDKGRVGKRSHSSS